MTEFVRVRQFNSEEGRGGGGGWQMANYAGQIIYFLHSIGYDSRIFLRAFLKAKRNKHTLKIEGGGVVEVQ